LGVNEKVAISGKGGCATGVNWSRIAWQAVNAQNEGIDRGMAQGKAKGVTCENCYFGKNMLCALNLGEPCPTFRPADRGLEPERQLAFVFRTERRHTAYAFPQPHA
jgi:hypothetical protein